MRLFLAIEIPAAIKKQLDEQLVDIKKKYPDFNWVNPENYHITVHFFGETENANLIKKKISDILYDQENFYLYSSTADLIADEFFLAFVQFRREKKLEKLAEKIKNYYKDKTSDRKFIPHLTIGRGKKSSKQQYFVFKKKLDKLNIDISFHVTKLVLYESILTGRTPVYRKITSLALLKN